MQIKRWQAHFELATIVASLARKTSPPGLAVKGSWETVVRGYFWLSVVWFRGRFPNVCGRGNKGLWNVRTTKKN